MVKFTLIANCQTQSLELLLQHRVASAVVWSTDFLLSDPSDAQTQQKILKHFVDSDFIIIQHGGQGIFDAASVKQQFPKKTIIIAPLYLRGVQPDCCYIGKYEDRFQNPSLYHSVAVLDAFLSGQV